MNNKEKAINIGENNLDRFLTKRDYGVSCALEMAQWKENQMIEKAIKFIDENTFGMLDDGVPYIQSIHDTSKNEFIEDFKKYMEEQ